LNQMSPALRCSDLRSQDLNISALQFLSFGIYLLQNLGKLF